MERLDKFLCDSGAGSRSQVKLLVKSGAVTVDGTVVRDSSIKTDPPKQEICLNGERLGGRQRIIAMLNKPAGFVTSTDDHDGITVMSLLPQALLAQDVKPVGRLDKQTEGLLLFTNDGELLHRLISPKKDVPKRYYARHEGMATQEDVAAFATGLVLGDGTVCRSALLEPLGAGESYITVTEGKYHQVRRMMASRGMTVTYLERQSEGNLTLGDLPRGQVRVLTEEEIADLV